jgi:prepilin-type N-terminal cleavage/methylation domain-containing protein
VKAACWAGAEVSPRMRKDNRVLKQLRSTEDQNIIEKGFTLVELLIVIVILGILAGIVVFAVGNLTSNAKTNACSTEKSTISTALEAYKAQNGAYPAAMSNLTSGTGALLKSTPTLYTIDGAGNISVTTAGTAATCS